ncbi:hypothetical protein [Chelativorans sp. J32]|uniref:hypothetical protein n=1 Tax=Chelativorans sp. J32 TaxID=935840 RepID=UPI0004B89776
MPSGIIPIGRPLSITARAADETEPSPPPHDNQIRTIAKTHDVSRNLWKSRKRLERDRQPSFLQALHDRLNRFLTTARLVVDEQQGTPLLTFTHIRPAISTPRR